MGQRQFKTVMFGYEKSAVDDAINKLRADMDILVEDSKNKIKQAQNIAMQSNKALDDLQSELEKIKKELNELKNSNKK